MATKNTVLTQTVYEMGAKEMHYWWEHSSMKVSKIFLMAETVDSFVIHLYTQAKKKIFLW